MAEFREPFFGRSELEWEELESVGWDLLLNCRVRLTSCTDLNNDLARLTGQPTWNLGSQRRMSAR
jgi:hypothetical protein